MAGAGANKVPHMLYRFKSRATADLILLEPHGRLLLGIIGKQADAQGIIALDQIPAALAALDQAVAAGEAEQPCATELTATDENPTDAVTLRQRVVPFKEMLRRSAQGGQAVVWGV